VLRLAEAADGYLARIRLPGGLIGAEQVRVLARLADELGDGRIELTSRGNVQLRGLAAGAAGRLTDELAQAGLLPSMSHERVRNVVASPLAGVDGGPDLTGIVRALDAGLCARPRLAELSGRFLFAVDDGRGDVAGLGADVVARVLRDGAVVNGLAVSPGGADAVVSVMLACAEAFVDLRAAGGGVAWRIADLTEGAERVRAAVSSRLGLTAGGADRSAASVAAAAVAAARPVGVVGTGAVLVAPLGRMSVEQLGWLAGRVSEREARITPWRSVVLTDVADADAVLREAAGLGFGVDSGSPWLRVSACAGRPGCASALADVQADAASFAARWPDRIVHRHQRGVSGERSEGGTSGCRSLSMSATARRSTGGPSP
jgi:precorrin-3B synthase